MPLTHPPGEFLYWGAHPPDPLPEGVTPPLDYPDRFDLVTQSGRLITDRSLRMAKAAIQV